MVRVMNLQKQARSGAEPTGPDKLSPAKQLSEIRRKVLEIVDQAEDLWRDQLRRPSFSDDFQYQFELCN